MEETINPITPEEFASKVKAKYPQYKDVDDVVLAQKMIEKYPEYKSQVTFPSEKKNLVGTGVEPSVESNGLDTSLVSTKPKTLVAPPNKAKTGFPEVKPLPGIVPDTENLPVSTQKPPKKEKEYRGQISKKIADFGRGSAELGVDIASIPDFAYDAFSVPQNFIAKMFDVPSLHTSSEEFDKTRGTKNHIKEIFQKEVQQSREKAQKVDKQYEQGIYDSFASGDIKGGLDQLSSSFTESLPSTISMMLGGAVSKAPQLLAASTMMFGAGKNEQLKKENPTMSTNARTANAFGTGLAEGAFETLSSGSFGAAAKGLVEKEGAKKGMTILKDGIYDFVVNAAKKNPFLTEMSTEGITEFATTVAQNSVDKVTGVKPEDYNVFTGAADSFIAGAAGGATFGGIIHGINEVGTHENQQAVKQNTKQVFKLQNELNNPTLPEDIKQQINTKIDDLIKTNQKIIQSGTKHVEELHPTVRTKLIETIGDLETHKDKAKQIQLDDTMSKDSKTILLQDLKTKYKEDLKTKQDILEGNYTPVDALPLKQRDKIKREALNQLKDEMNPDGKKDVTITDEMITKRANKIHEEVQGKIETKKSFDNLSLSEHNNFINQAHEELVNENVPKEERSYPKIKERAVELYDKSLQAPVQEETAIEAKDTTIPQSEGNFPLQVVEPQQTGSETEVNLPQTEQTEQTPQAVVTFKEAIADPNKTYIYNGEKGNITLDGQQVVFQTPTTIHELGNVDELSDSTLDKFGITKDRINVNQDNTIEIDNQIYTNPELENKGKAVKTDKKGNPIVTLINSDGNKVTFRGEDAVDLANKMQNANDTSTTTNAPIDGNIQPGDNNESEVQTTEQNPVVEEGVQPAVNTANDKGNPIEEVPPIKEEKKAEPTKKEVSNTKETGAKSISKRILEGKNSEDVTNAVASSDINYEKDNQEQTWNKVADLFKEFNSFEMYQALQNDTIINPSAVTAAYGQLLEQMPIDIEKELSKITNEEDKATVKQILWDEYGRIVDEFASRATAFGQANAMVNKVIQKSENVRYNLKRQTESYKAFNNGVIDAETQRTFEETDAKLKVLEEKIKVLEKEKADQEAQQAFENVQEEVSREKSKKPKQKAKDLANKIREIKIHKPSSFSAATPASLAWDLGVETVAKTVEAGGSIVEAIQNGLEKIKNTKWYESLSEEQKNNAANDFNESFSQDKKGNIKAVGKTITTPNGVEFSSSLFREYVKQGMDNIDTIAKQIKEDISEEYPDAEIRDIRDGLSGYGKTLNPSKDQVTKEISRLKTIGKLLSAKEDVLEGESPKKSGFLRAKPDFEARTLRKEINAIMKEKGLDSQELEKKWAGALDKIKSSLKNQIEELNKQIESGEKRKVDRTTTELDQEAKELKNERDQKKKLLDKIAGRPELSDEQKIKRAERALDSSVSKLKEQIELGEFDAKKNNTSLDSPKLKELRAEKSELLAQKKQMQIESGAVEKARLEMAKNRVKAQMDDLNRRIKESDFTKKEIKPVRADEELRQLKEEKIRLFEVYDAAKYKAELKNRTTGQKAIDITMETVNLMRIASGLDLGLMFLQLGPLTVSRRITKPILFAKDMITMFKAMGSEKFSKKMNAELKSNPYYPLAEECKLSLTSVDYKLSINEDQFTGDMTNVIWNGPLAVASDYSKSANSFLNKDRTVFGDFLLGKKNGDKISIIQQWKNSNIYPAVERGLITYANTLRMQEFEKGAEMLRIDGKNQEDNLADYKKVAAAVNTLTGRANMPKEAAGINKLLTAVFFSPRNAVAIVNQVNPFWYASLQYNKEEGFKSPITIKNRKVENNLTVANKLAMHNMARYVVITTTFALLVKAAFGDDAEDLEWDPRSYNAGKIIVKVKNGDKITFDPWGGKFHQISMFTKLFLEQTKDIHTKKISSLEKADRGSKNRGEIFGEYVGNKLSPAGSFAWSYLTAKNKNINGKEVKVNRYTGEPIKGSFFPSLAPMYWAGFYELQKQDPSAFTELMGAASIMGINTNIIKKPKPKSHKSSSRGRGSSSRGRTSVSRM
jgi:hypothetical protein